MKKILPAFLLVAFTLCTVHAEAATTEKAPTPPSQKSKKHGKRKKLTRQQGHRMQKNAEKEAKQHQVEMRRREYQQMQESQQRAAMQMQQQSQGKQH